MPHVRVQEADFQLDELAGLVRADEVGAVVTFLGTVRSFAPDGQRISGMSWECYESMAVRSLTGIADDAIARFGLHDVAVIHRIGERTVGDTLVAIVCASAHRRPAFDACQWIMDEIKLRAPLWKKEHLLAGDSRWVGYDHRRRDTTTPDYSPGRRSGERN